MSAREAKPRPAAKTEPKRIRVNVPQADESVLAWFELQENHSLSVRQLIRESIARDGYTDVVNRPVAQLPKRGRPPGQAGEDLRTVSVEGPSAGSGAEPVPAQPGAVPVVAELDLSEPASTGPELLGIALQAPALVGTTVLPAAPTVRPDPEPAPEPSGQVDVNDLMSALRG